jgi:phosphoribosylamine-glycine ligase
MKIGLVLAASDGAWFGLQLARSHDLFYTFADDHYAQSLSGLLPPPREIPDTSDLDLVVFDFSGYGSIADSLRPFTPTIGSSKFSDSLELDRVAGIRFMEQCGIKVPPWQEFDNPADALSFIKKTKKRYVLKPSGSKECAATYVSTDAEDMTRYIEVLFKRAKVEKFVLQEFVAGTEVSTEMWVSRDSYHAVNHTLEEKKLLAGGLGPNCGCAGSVVWMPNQDNKLFARGLKHAVEPLQAEGFVGPIDLNSIVTDSEVYGLEWTPRLGYDATCCLLRLLPIEFGEFLHRTAIGDTVTLGPSRSPFAASIRLYISPYPIEARHKSILQEGVPIEGLIPKDLETFYANDVRLRVNSDEELETAGTSGFIGCPIGVGQTVSQAFEEVKAAIKRLKVPNLAWRNDVPEKIARRYSELERGGWLRPVEAGS